MRNLFIAAGAFAVATLMAPMALADPAVALEPSPCVLSVGTYCHFEGNVTPSNLDLVDAAYNGQLPVPPELLALDDLAFLGEYLPADEEVEELSGTIADLPFFVEYYIVKAGSQFNLYRIAPTNTFSWDTSDLCVGKKCSHPGLSHLIYLGDDEFVPPTGGPIPEPATWAMMLLGFFGMGSAIRMRRRNLLAA